MRHALSRGVSPVNHLSCGTAIGVRLDQPSASSFGALLGQEVSKGHRGASRDRRVAVRETFLMRADKRVRTVNFEWARCIVLETAESTIVHNHVVCQ